MKHLLTSALLLVFFVPLAGQVNSGSFQVKKVTGSVQLDGILDDEIWKDVLPQTNFHQYFPSDTVPAKYDTEIYVAYDDQFLYLAAKSYSAGNDFRAISLKRDYRFFDSDNVAFVFDSFSDKTNGYMFGMNALGVRREALISNGGRQRQDFDGSWDNKWDGETKQYEDHWICEMAIPFNSVRFNSGSKKWRFNAYRLDFQDYEITSLTKIPSNNIIADLTNMTDMIWEEPLTSSGKNISLIPYVSAAMSRDYEDLDQEKSISDFGIGGDAKIAITSGLNLDLTINPDFSQVEVDRQVTNLQRFEVFFPERRQFFLENADLFGRFGAGFNNPFFSRRIGISRDTTTDENVQNAILFGARLSGKLNEKLRVGLINMQTAAQQENDLPSFNYSVLAAEQRVFDRSNIAFILVNKQAINPDDFGPTYDPFNRVAGIEYRLATADNVWSGKATYHHAITSSKNKNAFSHIGFINYNKRAIELEYFQSIVGAGYDAQVGFVQRTDIWSASPEVKLKFYPQNDVISNSEIGFDVRLVSKLGKDDNEFVPNFELIEKSFELSGRLSFTNSARLNGALEYETIKLLDDFDPTRIQADSVFLAGGTDQRNIIFRMNYTSDNRKNLFYNFRPLISSFYGGTRAGFSGNAGYRFQPIASLGLNWNYNYINLGGDFETAQLWLLGPRFDFSFTKKIFLTTFVQFNNQAENLNINARLQWRFKPASDFFIVYTDNYLSEDFSQFEKRNRSIVAKLTYWLNI